MADVLRGPCSSGLGVNKAHLVCIPYSGQSKSTAGTTLREGVILTWKFTYITGMLLMRVIIAWDLDNSNHSHNSWMCGEGSALI